MKPNPDAERFLAEARSRFKPSRIPVVRESINKISAEYHMPERDAALAETRRALHLAPQGSRDSVNLQEREQAILFENARTGPYIAQRQLERMREKSALKAFHADLSDLHDHLLAEAEEIERKVASGFKKAGLSIDPQSVGASSAIREFAEQVALCRDSYEHQLGGGDAAINAPDASWILNGCSWGQYLSQK